MQDLKKHINEFCERIETLLNPLGIRYKESLFCESKIEYYSNICCELRDTGGLDSSKFHTMDLFHFTNSMIQMAKAIELDPTLGWYEWEPNGDSSGLLELMYLGLGYALIYEDDSSVLNDSLVTYSTLSDSLGSLSTDHMRAMAAVARMKHSSFKSAVSLAGIQLSSVDDNDLISFVKSRRGFKPLNIYDGEAIQDDFKFYYSEHIAHSYRFLANTLINRAKWRKIDRTLLCHILRVDADKKLEDEIILLENATTVSELLSLNLEAYLHYLQKLEFETLKEAIAIKYSEARKVSSKVDISDIKSDDERITPTDFIEMVKSIGHIHPSYGSNKELMGVLLNSGIEIGIELTVKTVTLWLNASNKNLITEQYIKAEYDAVSDTSEKYGRHSALRIYDQLGYAPAIKLSIMSVGEAKKVLNSLK